MKRKNLGRAVLVLFLLLPALAVWWPLWFMGTGALMPLDELRAALGPVLQGAEGSAFWPLLNSVSGYQPAWSTPAITASRRNFVLLILHLHFVRNYRYQLA